MIIFISNVDIDTATGDISEYEGPAQNFPFKAIRLLGAGQLILALLLEILVIIQIALGFEDRYVFLASGSVGAWTPIAVGKTWIQSIYEILLIINTTKFGQLGTF